MSDKKLSELIEAFRVERPSEWLMDDFKRQAERLESELAALQAQVAEAERQEPVAMVVHHNPPFGAVYKVEWYTKYRDLPVGTKLYAAPVPAAVPDGIAKYINALDAIVSKENEESQEWRDEGYPDAANSKDRRIAVLVELRAMLAAAQENKQ